jgi:hypothetical protein
MLKNTSSLFWIIATAANANNDKRLTTTIRKIIKDHVKVFGERTSLKFTRLGINDFIKKGFFIVQPATQTRDLVSIFNRSVVLELAQPGRARLIKMNEFEDLPTDPPREPNPRNHDVYPWPKDMPKLDPESKYLPPRPSAIVRVLVDLANFNKKDYCYPAQETIRERCKSWLGVKMCNGSLNYWLAWLERSGWILRQQRGKYKKDGSPSNKSTLYYIADKAFEWLRRLTHWLGKLTGFRCLQKHGDDPTSKETFIEVLEDKGGASPVILSNSQREANLLRVRKLASGIFT